MMLSKTLHDGLSDYGIGVELGNHTGLSPALLSKIERGRLFPTLPTLLRIALVFGVGLEYFFAGAREKPLVAVVRKEQRVQLPERPAARDVAYRFELRRSRPTHSRAPLAPPNSQYGVRRTRTRWRCSK